MDLIWPLCKFNQTAVQLRRARMYMKLDRYAMFNYVIVDDEVQPIRKI